RGAQCPSPIACVSTRITGLCCTRRFMPRTRPAPMPTRGSMSSCCRRPGRGEAALAAGEVDVIWMGPIRVMKHHDDNPASPLVAFAEVVCRDPFSLIGAKPNPEFELPELSRLRFGSTSEVPTPWLCLEQDLRDAGIDPVSLPRITGRTMAENVAALADDSLDVAQLFEPFVEQAVGAGGHVWYPASAR